MWTHELLAHRLWLTAAGASRYTIRLRLCYLRHLAQQHPDTSPWELTVDDLAAFLARDDWAPETRRSARASVCGFYRWAVNTGRVERSPASMLPTIRVPRPVPRPAPDAVLFHALAVAGPRERLMIYLAAYAGLRRGEIAALHTGDIVQDMCGDSLRIHGKGGRVRLVPLHPLLHAELLMLEPGWVFPGKVDGHLAPHRVGVILSGLLGPGWTGHTLRHRFASRCYAAERDIRAVQELLGHSKVDTTQRYTAVPDGALRAAVNAT
jgi:integrase